MARQPAVAGQFYPGTPEELRSMLDEFAYEPDERQTALGALSPHAGYVFCGHVMGKVFGSIEVPETVVLLTPSHHARRPGVALWTGGPWKTPLGDVPLHDDLCSALQDLPLVTASDQAHTREHSGEVVLPFLQYYQPDVKVAVLCITPGAGVDDMLQLGQSIPDVLSDTGEEDALVVASSDMSHERAPGALDTVKENDPKAIEKMEQLDPKGLFDVCQTEQITMCGVMPATAMMESVRARGGSKGTLLERATSADSPYGSGSYVVGYAGMIFN